MALQSAFVGITGASGAPYAVRLIEALAENDAYHALETGNALVFTGSTGTNVNDLRVVLISGETPSR